MSLTFIFFTALVIALSGALMPGPLLTVTIAESARRGFIAGPLLILGHAILELLLVFALVMGFKSILASSIVIGTVGIIGGLFLLWMGFSMVKSSIGSEVTLELNVDTSKGNLNPTVAGIIASLSNPYWTLWWASIGATYVFWSFQRGIIGLIIFFFGHISGDLAWYSFVAAAIAGGRKVLNKRIYQVILALCGIFLIGLALYFFIMGVATTIKIL